MRHLNRLLAICIISLTASKLNGEELSPDQRLIRILHGIQTLHATFAHQGTSSEIQTGEIWLEKPGRFRVETSPPLSQTIVSDGESMWTHDRDLEQIIISPLNTRIDEMPILLFSGDPSHIPKNYKIEYFQSDDRQHFLLTPYDSTNLITTLVLSFEEQQPVSISVENAMHERTVIKLERAGGAGEMSDQIFSLTIPAFADVIDDRPG